MADKRISQLIERVDIANNDVLPIVASGATTTNKVTISTIQDWMQSNLDVGVTSVGLTMPSAFQVSGSPITTSGNINVTATGTAGQYIRGDGTLADFPSTGGGGSSVSYYLNGSVSQGTIGGIAYTELSKTPVLGAGTDFTIAADGYIASFITDVGDPGLLEIPAGNWNFETYLQASSSGGTPSFYIELYKVSYPSGTATLIASNSANPELIAFGTSTTPYFSALAVPQTTLALTDRLAIRIYVVASGRTITLHTENSNLCQVITTFTTGLTALNGLTAQVQNFATGTSGTDFNISSTGSIHTFNIPSASATNRGLLSAADWSTFNAKQDAGNYVTTDTTQTITGEKTFSGSSLKIAANGAADAVVLRNVNGTTGSDAGATTMGFNSSDNLFISTQSRGGFILAFNNSVSNRTYTLQDASGTLAFTSDLGAYLPLSGGTLTGALNGTSANFSDTLIASKSSAGASVTVANTGSNAQLQFSNSTHQAQIGIANLGSGAAANTFYINTSAGTIGSGITMNDSGAVTFANKITINTPSDGIGILLNGRTSDNFSSIRFGANTGGGQYNSISADASSFDISSLGNTPITFSTNTQGGGGTRMTIAGNGAVTLTGALNGTSASFTGNVAVGTNSYTVPSGYTGVGINNATNGGLLDLLLNDVKKGELYITSTSFNMYGFAGVGLNLTVDNNSSKGLSIATTGAATFSSSVGLGVTPNNSTDPSLESRYGLFMGRDETNLLNNAYFNSGWKYTQTGFASRYYQDGYNGGHNFYTASSGSTGGTITWGTPKMVITTGGNVGIGTASPSDLLHIRDASLNSDPAIKIGNDSRDWVIENSGSNSDTFKIYNDLSSNIFNITSGGNVGIGTASPSASEWNASATLLHLYQNSTNGSLLKLESSNASGIVGVGNNAMQLGSTSDDPVIFYTNVTERMRITSGGFLKASNDSTYSGISSSYHEMRTNQNTRVVAFSNKSATLNEDNGILIQFTAASPNNTTARFIVAEDSTATRFVVYSNGNVQNQNNSYGSLSDIKLKENIEDATPKLDDLMKVKVRNYNFIGDDKKQIGVIAQELEEVFPAMIDETPDYEDVEVPQLDEEGNEVLNEEGEVVTTKERVSKGTTTKSVKYSVFVPMLIKAMQEQQEQIKSLTEQVEALKSQING